MGVAGCNVRKSWKKAPAIYLCEGIMLKTAQLCATYVIAVLHCRYFLKKYCNSQHFRRCYGRLLGFEKRI